MREHGKEIAQIASRFPLEYIPWYVVWFISPGLSENAPVTISATLQPEPPLGSIAQRKPHRNIAPIWLVGGTPDTQ